MGKIALLTNLGEQWAAGRFAGTETSPGQYIGWGTGSGVAAKGDTDLSTPASEGRVTGAVSLVVPPGGSPTDSYYQVEGILTADSDKVITNAGTFTASVNGVMVIHASFDGRQLNQGDTITLTFTLNPS